MPIGNPLLDNPWARSWCTGLPKTGARRANISSAPKMPAPDISGQGVSRHSCARRRRRLARPLRSWDPHPVEVVAILAAILPVGDSAGIYAAIVRTIHQVQGRSCFTDQLLNLRVELIFRRDAKQRMRFRGQFVDLLVREARIVGARMGDVLVVDDIGG